MKRLVVNSLNVLLSICCFNVLSLHAATNDTDSTQVISTNIEQIADQMKSYKDSIRRILYPEVRYYNYADSMQSYIIDPSVPNPAPDIIITPDPNPVIPLPVIGNVDKDCQVGEIEIVSGVTNTGGRTYEIPIKVYPGVNGCEPNITLSYNSQGGSSTVGYGWSIGGLSSISRGVKTLYYDGKVEGMLMHPMDPFYLDGNRLLAMSPVADTYIQYESEQGNIKARGYVNGSAMVYFEVFYPDGSKAIFGNTRDTEDNVQYPIMQLADRFGNTINYQYTIVNNVKLISQIRYGSGRMEFKYEQRQDPMMYYWGGKAQTIDSRISEINCYNGQELLWGYSLTYTYKNDASHLTKIDYHSERDVFNPLEFSYGTSSPQGGFEYIKTNLIACLSLKKVDS